MSAAPTPPEDDLNAAKCVRPGRTLKSSTLPPVLFELPNLSASCCAGSDDACAGSEMANTGCKAEETVDEGLTAPRVRESDSERPVFEPVPVSSDAHEPNPPAEPQPTSKAVEPRRETVSQPKSESAFDVWGTRAVVVTLLLLVISSAFVAARKSGSQSDQPVAKDRDGMSADDLTALEGFAVTEGTDVANTTVEGGELTSNDFGALLAESDLESTNDISDVPADNVASLATLAAPQNKPAANAAYGQQPIEPPAFETFANDGNGATFGPAETVTAATASSRIETPGPIEALKPADTIPNIPTSVASEQTDLPIDLNAVTPVAPQTKIVAEDLTGVANSSPSATPTESGAILYSSTPNGIADWDQYYEWMKSRIKTQTPTPQTN